MGRWLPRSLVALVGRERGGPLRGTVLQLLGLLTVAVGLRQTRKLFPGQPGVGDRVRAWFRQLGAAFRRPRRITGHGVAVGGAITLSGKARVRIGVGPDAPLERRLEVLEQNVHRLQDEFDSDLREISGKIGRAEGELRKEADERRQVDESMRRVIEEATIGGLNLEIIGLFWLMLGVLGQGCPDEIARLFAVLSGTRR